MDHGTKSQCESVTVKSIKELADKIGERRVAVSLTRHTDSPKYIIAVALSADRVALLEGEGKAEKALAELLETLPNVNIDVVSVPRWPPCQDPIYCEPGILALRQQHLNGLFEFYDRMMKR